MDNSINSFYCGCYFSFYLLEIVKIFYDKLSFESKKSFYWEARGFWIVAIFELANIFYAHLLFQPQYEWVSSIIHFFVTLILLFHFLELVNKMYDKYTLIDEGIGAFKHALQRSNDSIDLLVGTMSQYDISKVHGVVKKISDPKIWNLTGEIIGWNPNWSIEMSKTKLSYELNLIHNERITSNFVDSIEYFFLEEYVIDPFNNSKFGSNCFLDFLNQLLVSVNGNNKRNFVDQAIKKYQLWKIPRDKWESDDQMKSFLSAYKDSILIGGKNHLHSNFVMFQNKKPFLNDGNHEYYFEIFGFDSKGTDTRIVTHINAFFRDLKAMIKSKNIASAVLSYDEANNAFRLD